MIYKNCIDASLDCVKACDRFAYEGCKTSAECMPGQDAAVACADVCNLVGRETAKGLGCAELFEVCANYCDETAKKCEKIDHKYAKDCATSAKKCDETCRECKKDCENKEKEKRD